MRVKVSFGGTVSHFKIGFSEHTVIRPEEYEGPYSVIPKIVSQTLETHSKMCRDDIEVEAVPYLEVSNPQGGYTATIAYL